MKRTPDTDISLDTTAPISTITDAQEQTEETTTAEVQTQTAASAVSYIFDLSAGTKYYGDVSYREMGDYDVCFYADIEGETVRKPA